MENKIELLKIAKEQLKYAYAPYSNFKVGAALLTKSGKIYTGCNIENAAFTPGNCGERTAIFKAVSEGEREFLGIAIVGGKVEDGSVNITDYCPPCGVCRQVMMEFADYDTFEVILNDSDELKAERIKTFMLKELLPMAFG